MKRLTLIDRQIFSWIAVFSENKLNTAGVTCFKWISKTGDGYLYFVIALLLYAFDKSHGTLFLFTALLAYCLEIPVYLCLKNAFKRPRPLDLLQNFNSLIVPSDKFSLPSGHTAAAFLMATVIAYYYPSFAGISYAWASLVGLSRIVLRVHYPFDVLLGSLIGAGFAAISINLLG